MRPNRLSMMLLAGALGLAINGCGNSGTGSGGTSGSMGSGGGAGRSAAGTSAAGSGGSAAASSTATGGSSSPTSSSAPLAGAGGTSAVTGGASSGGRSTTGPTGGTGSGGKANTGGTSGQGSGGTTVSGGTSAVGGTAGASAGMTASGGTATGGTTAGGTTGAGGGSTGGKTGTGTGSETCTPSKIVNLSVSGSGSHKVVVETNSDAAMACGTIYRPADLGGAEKYPIFVWGEGACSRDGKANSAAMAEIASHGYFVVADGPPNSGNCPNISISSTAAGLLSMAKPLLGYITWAIAENDKPCSAYFGSLETSKVAADGFSCGGLMASGTCSDPRITTYGITSSGLTSPDQAFYIKVQTPFKALTGSTDSAYANAKRDYEQISAQGIPAVFFSKDGAGHGGDLLDKNGGDFTKVNLAWLNWQLKGDTSAKGKGFLIGPDCTFCSSSSWEVKSKNIP